MIDGEATRIVYLHIIPQSAVVDNGWASYGKLVIIPGSRVGDGGDAGQRYLGAAGPGAAGTVGQANGFAGRTHAAIQHRIPGARISQGKIRPKFQLGAAAAPGARVIYRKRRGNLVAAVVEIPAPQSTAPIVDGGSRKDVIQAAGNSASAIVINRTVTPVGHHGQVAAISSSVEIDGAICRVNAYVLAVMVCGDAEDRAGSRDGGHNGAVVANGSNACLRMRSGWH